MSQGNRNKLDRHVDLYAAYHYGQAAKGGDDKAAKFEERFAGDAEAEAEFQRGFDDRDLAWEGAERECPNVTDDELYAVVQARAGDN